MIGAAPADDVVPDWLLGDPPRLAPVDEQRFVVAPLLPQGLQSDHEIRYYERGDAFPSKDRAVTTAALCATLDQKSPG